MSYHLHSLIPHEHDTQSSSRRVTPGAIPSAGTAAKARRTRSSSVRLSAEPRTKLGGSKAKAKRQAQFRALTLNHWSEASSVAARTEKRWLQSLGWEQLIGVGRTSQKLPHCTPWTMHFPFHECFLPSQVLRTLLPCSEGNKPEPMPHLVTR